MLVWSTATEEASAEDVINCIICHKSARPKDCCTWNICRNCHGGIEDVERCNRENVLPLNMREAVR